MLQAEYLNTLKMRRSLQSLVNFMQIDCIPLCFYDYVRDEAVNVETIRDRFIFDRKSDDWLHMVDLLNGKSRDKTTYMGKLYTFSKIDFNEVPVERIKVSIRDEMLHQIPSHLAWTLVGDLKFFGYGHTNFEPIIAYVFCNLEDPQTGQTTDHIITISVTKPYGLKVIETGGLPYSTQELTDWLGDMSHVYLPISCFKTKDLLR